MARLNRQIRVQKAIHRHSIGVARIFHWSPPLVLQLVATCTSTLRLATLVLNNDFRHPVVLAKAAATLDLLSGGRLDPGMGAGWQPRDYESEHPVRPGPGPRRTAARNRCKC